MQTHGVGTYAPTGTRRPQAHRRSPERPADANRSRDYEGGKVATYNGYCVKCKEKRDFEGAETVSKTGMKMAKGTCPVCGTTVNRILGKA